MDRRGRDHVDRDHTDNFGAERRMLDEEDVDPEIHTFGLRDLPPVAIRRPEPQPETPDDDKKAEEENKRRMAGMEQAKDRAQITAATAMSIVHVALLKNVLDASSEDDKYYSYRLGFIITALVLQVIAGIIALYIALLRNYYSEYKDDFWVDCCTMCCPWKIRWKQSRPKRPFVRRSIASATAPGQPVPKPKTTTESQHTGCCPFECTTNTYADFEYEVLEMYEDLTEEVIWSHVETANYDVDCKLQHENIEKLEVEKTELEHNENRDESKYAEKKKELQDAKDKLKAMKENKESADRLRAKGIALEGYVEKIYQQRVLKRATFWQNTLNMIFYIVFVLNAIITGIGLANPTIPVAANGVSTTPAPVNLTV